jgi:hypothetical protein
MHGRETLVFEVAWNSISVGTRLQAGDITDHTTISLQEEHAGILTCNDGFNKAKDLGVFRVLGEAACVPRSGVQVIIPTMSHVA